MNSFYIDSWDRRKYPKFPEWLDSEEFKELLNNRIDYEWDLTK